MLTSLQADAPAPIAAAFEGALRGVPIRYRLSSDGCTATPLDPANIATRTRAGGDAMLATRPSGPAHEDMARLTAHLRTMEPPEATAMLVDLIGPLLPTTGQRDAGEIVRNVASPLGGDCRFRARARSAAARTVYSSAKPMVPRQRGCSPPRRRPSP